MLRRKQLLEVKEVIIVDIFRGKSSLISCAMNYYKQAYKI